MSRFDKYDPVSGGFRARLGFAPAGGDVNAIIAVGLDANGRIVKGSGNTGVLGALCLTSPLSQGDVADVMTDGEIVDVPGLDAGTVYFGTAAGAVDDVDTGVRLGHTVEAWRLVVRVAR